MSDTAGYNDPEYLCYLEHRRSLLQSLRAQSQMFDRAILTLSGGALVLSITFLEVLADSPDSASLKFLYASWIMFGLSLVTILISFLTSVRTFQHAISEHDHDFRGESNEAGSSKEQFEFYGNVTRKLNLISAGLFIVGVASMAWFSASNIEGAMEMTDKKSDSIEKGLTSPLQPTATSIQDIILKGEPGFVRPAGPRKKEPKPNPEPLSDAGIMDALRKSQSKKDK